MISLFLTDYINGGELFTHLYQREKFTENEVRIYIGEIVLALEHLHKVRKSPRYFIGLFIYILYLYLELLLCNITYNGIILSFL